MLIEGSGYAMRTFKMVIEHVHWLILARGRLHREAKTALEILLNLAEKATLPPVDGAWIDELLKSAARGNMGDSTFALFLRLSARRKEEGAVVPSGRCSPEYPLFTKIMQNVKTCSERGGGWQDEAVYGGLIAVGRIPQLGSFLPDRDFLETLSKAVEEDKSLRVRKAAYDLILVAGDGWLRSADLRQHLMDLDLPRRLHGLVIDTGRSGRQRSFLMMMEVLSEDEDWHSYLRGAMDVWLSFRHEGQGQVLRILTRVGELPPLEYDGPNSPPLDRYLGKLVEDEWARVPGRSVEDLTARRLIPLAEATKQLKKILFTESERKAVVYVVEDVVPSLERRRDDSYEGPGEHTRGIVNDLLDTLRTPVHSTSPRSTF